MIEIFVMLIGAALIGFLLGWILQKLQRDRMQAELRFIRDKFETLQARSDTAMTDHSDLMREIEDLRARKDALFEELEVQKQEHAELEQQLADSGRDEGEILTELRGRLETAETEMRSLREQLAEKPASGDRETEIERLKQVIRTEQEEKETWREKAVKASENQTSAEDLEELLRKVGALEAEKAALTARLSDGKAAENNSEELLKMKEELEKSQRLNRELKNDIEDLEDRLEERPVNIGDPKEIAALRKEIAALKADRDALAARVADTPAAVPAAEAVAQEAPPMTPAQEQAARKQALLASVGKASEANKNSLTRIVGIGPFIEAKLNSIGIFTFDQISRFSEADIERVTHLIEFFPGRIERDGWVRQANKLLNKTEDDSLE